MVESTVYEKDSQETSSMDDDEIPFELPEPADSPLVTIPEQPRQSKQAEKPTSQQEGSPNAEAVIGQLLKMMQGKNE